MRIMKEKLKRILAGVLAVCMMVALLPAIQATAETPDLYYNFLKLCLRRENGFNTTEAVAQNNKGVDITTVTDFAMTTKGSETEINKNADNYGPIKGSTDPWHYVDKSSGATFKFVSWEYAMQFDGGVGSWASIKIKVPADGKYIANSVNGYWIMSPIVRIYLAPENAENPRDAKYALNTVDAYAAQGSDKWNIDTPLAPVDLTAGNYILTYEMVGKNENATNTRFCVSGFKLKAVSDVPDLSVSCEDTAVAIDETKELSLLAAWDSSMVWDMYGAEITATSRDAGIATASVSGGKVSVTGKSNGTTVVDVVVKKNGAQIAACSVNIAVGSGKPEAKDMYYNFLKLCLRRENGFNTTEAVAQNNKGVDITTVTDFAMTTKGSATEINKNADNYGSPTGATDPWHYVDKSSGATMKFVSYSYAMQFDGGVGSWASIKIKVPADGKYIANSVNGYWIMSPIVRIYLAPENAENPRDAKYALNTVDAYAAQGSDKWNVDTPLAPVDLTAGNYILTYEMVGKNENATNTRFCVSGFKLKVAEDEPTLAISGEAVELEANKSREVELSVGWTNGIVWDAYGAEITATPRDTDIAAAEVTGKKVKVTAKKSGETVIDLAVKKDGKQIASGSMKVTVVGGELEPINLNYNFLKLCLRRENGFSTPEAIAQANKGVDVTTLTDFAMTTKGTATEINKNADNYGSPTGATDPWHYVGVGNGGSFKFVSYDYAMQVKGSAGAWAAIKIKVPRDGIYSAYSVHGYWKNSPMVRFYIAPENAANPRDAKYAISSIDAYPKNGKDVFNVETPIGNVNLTAGNYIVSYEIIGKNESAGNTVFCVQAFRLKQVTQAPTLTLSVQDAEAPIGGDTYIPLNAVWSDGAEDDLYSAEVIAVAEDSELLDVSAENIAAGKRIKLIGKLNGRTKVNVTVKRDGNTLGACSFNVDVTGTPPKQYLNLNYNFLKLCLRRENGFSTPEAIAQNNKGTPASSVTSFAMTTKGDPAEINKNADNYGNPTGATDPWHFVALSGGATFNFVSSDYAMQVSGSVGGRAQIKIKVPQDGIYTAYSVHGYWHYSSAMRIYLAPEDAADPTAPEYILNAEDTYVESSKQKFNIEVPYKTVALTAGNYIVTYETIGQNEKSAGTRFCVQAFRLKEVDELAQFAEFTAESVPTLAVGAEKEISLDASMSDGSVNILTGMTITATAGDASVVKAEIVDKDFNLGKKLKITALAPGKTEITVTVKDGDTVLAECIVPVSVSDGNSPVKSIMLKLRKANVAVGKFTTASVTATLEDGLVTELAADKVEFSSENEGIAQVSADGKVTAIKEGETNIVAVCDGKITAKAKITVIPRDIVFNYLKLDYRKGEGVDKPALHNTGVPLGSVVSFDMTTEGHEREINPSSMYSTEPWHFHSTNKATFNFVSSEYALQMRATSGKGEASVKIRVPFDGVYQAISEEGYWAHSPIVRYYLAPADAKDPVAPEYSIGINDTYLPAAQQKFNVDYPLDIVELTAGDYILTYQIVGKNPDALNYYYCVTAFKLDPVDEVPVYELSYSAPKPANPGIESVIKVSAVGSNGAKDALYDAEIRAQVKDASVADVVISKADIASPNRNVTVVGKKPGSTEVVIYVTRDGEELEPIVVPVTIKTPVLASMHAELERTHLNLNRDPVQIKIIASDPDGDPLSIPYSACSFEVSDTSVVSVDENGMIIPKSEGRSDIGITVTFGGKTLTDSVSVTAGRSKTESTYYTQEKREAALENAQAYSWGRALHDSTVRRAEKYVSRVDELWHMIPGEGLPRAITVGLENDPDSYTCRYCGVDIRAKYGAYAWITDALNDPWKIQCPGCRRKFPSNDFGAFYELGLNEHGIFDIELAKARNQELVNAGKPGYLKNVLYPEAAEKFGDANWGVDDGFGYRTGRNYSNGVAEVHTYIAYYLHYGLWRVDSYGAGGTILDALTALRDAYLYTGKEKYGRAGAILLDRIADVWPDYSLMQYFQVYSNSHGGTGEGKIIGREWEAMTTAPDFALAYDAFYPLYEDEQIISFLSEKAAQYNLKNPKTNADLIRRNAEDGILREIFRAVKKADIHGNFGVHQNTLSIAAVVLDSMPETGEMIDWIMQSGTKTQGKNTGGDVLRTFIDLVDRDGHGNESAPNYNRIWMNSTITFGEVLSNYKGYAAADIFSNPKVQRMMTSFADINLLGQGVPAIGDAGKTGGKYYEQLDLDECVKLYRITGNPDYARLAWYLNGDSSQDICKDIFVKNPTAFGDSIKHEVEKYGEWDFNKSTLLSGYGFAALRDGKAYDTATVGTWDVQRDFWMYFGGANTSHKHLDALNLGIDAYGVNVAPDLGYPEATGTNPNRYQWINTTISHNTVVVNETEQTRNIKSGFPMHYDDADRVKLVDVSLPQVYAETEEYRRTLVMVDVDGEVSYGIDFFRVSGGQDHLYSFHAMSNEVSEYVGFDPVTQIGGSYAGADVPWGEDPYTVSTSISVPLKFPKGYTWLKNVRRADAPNTGEFAVDFKIMNFMNSFPRNMDLHLRMTMLNDFDLSEITLADGVPPRTGNNPDAVTYVLARRKGQGLDSLFTTVYEPYVDSRYIRSMENVALEAVEGDMRGKCVKIIHEDDRVDYVLYSEDNTTLYKITDGDTEFFFRGFVGVYTIAGGTPVYRYINDGDILGERESVALKAVTGTVSSFTETLAEKNILCVEIAQEIQQEDIIGRMIHIENDGTENAVYQIKAAERGENGSWTLDLGNTTLIRSLKNSGDINGGYIYNIANGQSFVIPLSFEEDNSITIKQADKQRASSGYKLTYAVEASQKDGLPLTYAVRYAPRGASVSENGIISWTPDNAQIGEHIVAVEISDGSMTKCAYIPIEVYKSSGSVGGGTTSSNSSIPSNPSGSGSGTGGSSSGSGGSADAGNADPGVPNTGNTDTGDINAQETTEKFTDLGNHEWAKDAVYALVDKGVVNGTSSTTFSPANNIKRADFAVMLVRAFGITEGDGENFADVAENKYYAEELRLAKAAGIINGIGDNKFNPDGEISRQDMMLMLARALDAVEYGLDDADRSVLEGFADASEVVEYAADAVSRVIKAGIIAGANGKLNPLAKATRAEIAVMLDRVLKK